MQEDMSAEIAQDDGQKQEEDIDVLGVLDDEVLMAVLVGNDVAMGSLQLLRCVSCEREADVTTLEENFCWC